MWSLARVLGKGQALPGEHSETTHTGWHSQLVMGKT
jgi:hypothetical protein